MDHIVIYHHNNIIKLNYKMIQVTYFSCIKYFLFFCNYFYPNFIIIIKYFNILLFKLKFDFYRNNGINLFIMYS